MKKTFKYSLLSLILVPLVSQAIGIDAMMKFAEYGKTNFTISSTADFRQFMQVGITQLDVKDGEIIKTAYSRENIQDWSLFVRPARTVIEPHLSKLFQVEYSPTLTDSSEKDKAYQLSFIPTPYFAEGEPVTHSVKIAMGFAPIVIVPAKQDKPIRYKMQYGTDGLTLINYGETYLRAMLDACPDGTEVKDRDTCSTVVYALSGRHLPISLSEGMKQTDNIKVELSTHNMDYENTFTLKQGQISTNQEG